MPHDITKFDPHTYRYPSRRSVTFGTRGMIASSQPLASQAGLEILKKGGNAIDAAIATAAALTVLEPTSNGLGSDAFALIWKDGKLHGINGSGQAPKSWSINSFKAKGHKTTPILGWDAATVPGAVATWAELSQKMGRLPLAQTLAPAIQYAAEGFPVATTCAYNWNLDYQNYTTLPQFKPMLKNWLDTFCPQNRAPRPGEIIRLPHHAQTLQLIAQTNGKSFYQGETSQKILHHSQKTDGHYTQEDLASFAPQWITPININYKGYHIWQIPPNGQGITVLMALSILKNFQFHSKDDPQTYHIQIEAIKLAFQDAHRHVADPRFSHIPTDQLLSDQYGQERAKLISQTQATDFQTERPKPGGTVYFCTADGEGNMVSFIQSNYMGYGSGIVVPQTGIALNNRGACFSFDPTHPNALEGGKRPYNTIIPGFITKDDAPIAPFGVMGAFMQPQGQVQIAMNLIDFGMNPQEALDAPRWQWLKEMQVAIEPSFPTPQAQKLSSMGHHITPYLSTNSFGRGQIILKTQDGSLAGGTEPRSDGSIATY